MTIYQKFVFPLLRRMDAEVAHERTLTALALAQRMWPGPVVLRQITGQVPRKPIELFGLRFPNMLGMAAGFDKDVKATAGLALLGFGHVEVGTLTPQPQVGNPRPRIFRLPEDGALINQMGFPNGGAATAVSRLKSLDKSNFILGVSLGKQKETPLADAAADYTAVMQAVYPYADYLAVNISSPNTPGLRDLQGGDYLGQLLRVLQAENENLALRHEIKKRPLLVKIAPDLTWAELDEILTAAADNQIDGIIATNTTLSREELTHPNKKEQGGMSGRPLRQRSNEIIAYIHRQTVGQLPIIGVGGVRTADDVRAKLDAGASLVQLYTGLIYEGPGMAGRILRELVGILACQPVSLSAKMLAELMNKRLEATINGRVQGVNFRYYTQQTANELHLSGWVMNQPDGSVRVTAEGPPDRLERLAEFLQRGQPPARVDQVKLIWAEPTHEFTRFSIRWF